MTAAFELLFSVLAVLVFVAVPLYAYKVRGRTYAIFSGVNLLVSLPGAWVVGLRLVEWAPAWLEPMVGAGFVWGLMAGALHLAHLVRARLRSRVFRLLVSIPGQVFVAAGFMSGLVMLALLPVRGVLLWFDLQAAVYWLDCFELLPLALAAFSVATSMRPAQEWVRVRLAPGAEPELRRVPVQRSRNAPQTREGLRVVQITDPHLGPWQSVRSLQQRIESLLEEDPDLVLLTGDFLTMEGRGSPGSLALALEPLRVWNEARRARGDAAGCFAIFGNHDHEDPDEVRSAMEHAGARLLIDEEVCVDTAYGPVQVLGANYVFRELEEHIGGLLRDHPRLEGHVRLLLLHDPLGFTHVPDGAVDLTLSGHTHGGQVGLVSFGFDWTVLTRTRWPDHGLFAKGLNHLYVHRGTGFYGFPLRVGVPGELSVLELLLP